MKNIVITTLLINVLLNLTSCSKKNEMNKDEIRISEFFNDNLLSNQEFYKLRPLDLWDISNHTLIELNIKVEENHPLSVDVNYPLSKKDLLRFKGLSKLEKEELHKKVLEKNAVLVNEIISCSGDLGAMTSYINNQIKFKNELLCPEELSEDKNIVLDCYQQEINNILESKLILPYDIKIEPFMKRLNKLNKDIQKCNATLSEHNEHNEHNKDLKTPVKPFTKRFNQ